MTNDHATRRREDGEPWWCGQLQCPATGEPLERRDRELVAGHGEHSYPVIDGVPILIAGEQSAFDATNADGAGPGRAGLLGWVLKRWPSDTANVGGEEHLARLHELLTESPRPDGGRRRLLVIGGAIIGADTAPIIFDERLDVLETDVYIGPRTQVVCDGHDLPFADGSFDGVLCQAVLEHVADPPRVVEEIHRVLAPDGIVYSEIPFLQAVHEGAYDVTRYTLVGHRRLYRRFDEISSGVICGPGMALAWAVRYWLRAVVPQRESMMLAAGGVARLLTFWLVRLDRRLIKRPAAEDAAAGTGFLGRRRTTPRSDRDIFATYGGASSAPSEPTG